MPGAPPRFYWDPSLGLHPWEIAGYTAAELLAKADFEERKLNRGPLG